MTEYWKDPSEWSPNEVMTRLHLLRSAFLKKNDDGYFNFAILAIEEAQREIWTLKHKLRTYEELKANEEISVDNPPETE